MKEKLWARMLLGAALGMGVVCQSPAVSAHGNIWMDENQGVADKNFIAVKDYKKIILFPIRYLQEPDGRVDQLQEYNDMLFQRVNKRIRRTNFPRFEDPADPKKADKKKEKLYILRDDPGYEKLLQHFPTEKDRAKAVYDLTGAQGYLLPHIRWENERIDTSPATWKRVHYETYYNIVNGPQGNKYKLNYQSWYGSHQIPSHSRTLQMLDMDFVIYDAYTGKKAMTLIDYYRCYDVDQRHAFDQIAKNFTGDWNRLKKDHDNPVPANAPTVGFENLAIPANAARDEFAIKTIYYAYKDEAGDTLKGARAIYTADPVQYYVRGQITAYDRGQTWNPPYVTTSLDNYKTQKFKWTDDKGNEHEGKYEYYRTRVDDNFGYYSFWYRAAAHLELVDAHTGQVVLSRDASAEDPDRYANALRSIFHSFYKDVDRAIGVKAD